MAAVESGSDLDESAGGCVILVLLDRNCLQQLCTQSCARRSERMGFLVLLRGARMGVRLCACSAWFACAPVCWRRSPAVGMVVVCWSVEVQHVYGVAGVGGCGVFPRSQRLPVFHCTCSGCVKWVVAALGMGMVHTQGLSFYCWELTGCFACERGVLCCAHRKCLREWLVFRPQGEKHSV